jgi:hypothetical protein
LGLDKIQAASEEAGLTHEDLQEVLKEHRKK